MIVVASRSRSFKRTVNYLFRRRTRVRPVEDLTDAEDMQSELSPGDPDSIKQEIVEDRQLQRYLAVSWVRCEELPSQRFSQAHKIMRATANQNLRCKRPVYAMSIYLDRQDLGKASQQFLIDIGREFVDSLGLLEHQRIYIGPLFKRAPVLHVVVNRVHPETLTAAELKFDHLTLSRCAEQLEKAYDLKILERRQFVNALRASGEFVKGREHPAFSKLARTPEDALRVITAASGNFRWTQVVSDLDSGGLSIEMHKGEFIIKSYVFDYELVVASETEPHASLMEAFVRWEEWKPSYGKMHR